MLKRSVVVLAIAAIVTVLAAQPLAVQASAPSAAQTTQVRIATLFDLLTDVEGTELDQEPTPLRRRDGPETEEPVGWTDIQDLVLLDVELSERAADALVTAVNVHATRTCS